MSSRAVRRFATWIALIAIMAVTFVPMLTSAMSTYGGNLNICSADASRSTLPADGHHPLEHCPFCALHWQLAMPPAHAGAAATVATRFSELPAAFLHAPRATGVWSASQPRGPPLFA
jgi:hypothetical protein